MAQEQHQMRNYGLKLNTQKDPRGYVLGGGNVPFEVLQPDGDWQNFLPQKEAQNLNGVEPYACVSYTILNCVEMLIKRKYGLDRNYSDRFLAFVSGTPERMGNDPHDVCEFLRKLGVVPEELWPFDAKTFDEYYKPIPQELYDIAKEFTEEWEFLHEYVPETHAEISKALTSSPLLISVPAWFKNEDGLYYRPNYMMPDNHATTLVYERVGEFRRVFDTYDNPFLKDVAWHCVPMIIKRFYIAKKDKPAPDPIPASKPRWIVSFLKWLRNKVNLFLYFKQENEQK